MKQVLHRANTRGHANHGWLDSHHTFSFANYWNPERMGFGKLRVINDDVVDGGKGFGTHPHQNMEIISIPLSGDLAHKDSMGHTQVIEQGDVQIMSAGTGVTHSEFNYHAEQAVNFLQIWVLPKAMNIQPRYDQRRFAQADRHNQWQTVVSPEEGLGLWINQDAYFSLGHLDKGTALEYTLHQPQNGVYVFVIEGQVSLGGQVLSKRDGMGLWEAASFSLEAHEETEVLLMEVPMD